MAINTLATISTVFRFAGLLRGARAARREGARERMAAEFVAEQLDEQAGQTIAAAQRRAFEERRAARLTASRSLAVAAASGGGVTDPTVINLLAGIQGEGAYRAAVAMYQGEAEARQKRIQAKATRLSGRFAEQAGRQRARAFTLRAAGEGISLFAKYGGGGADEEP